jgi:demethylmenaquinone methyltransferase/2-methoxy-6-polyprenyl-1,4-benzoquinol methylase
MGPISPIERRIVVIVRSDDDLTQRRLIAQVKAYGRFDGSDVIMETVTTGANADRVLQEQIGYYRARATEYDEWFLRLGRYDHGEDATRHWFDQVDQVRAALATVALDGAQVLELAPGTGIWTAEICARAKHVTAVDASPEMMDLNRQRLGADAAKVTYIEADLFEWQPEESFDAVVFCFWISHIPANRLDRFLAKVATMTRPGGSVFFLDGRRERTSTASDHTLPAIDEELMVRHLDDGRQFTIVKNFWMAPDLEARCARAGLDVKVSETRDYFQYGVGRRL